jgi:thiol-disulfide isomerase/thioredoxin
MTSPTLLVFRSLLAFTLSSLALAADKPTSPTVEPADNAELTRLYHEDQSDRQPGEGKRIDWNIVGPRDKAREARIKELYAAGQLKTGADYYHAAMVLQHADEPDDYLLAHELCVVALGKGYTRALWLAAATEDRFLRSLKRPQRFGTQSISEGNGSSYLEETDPRVTDEHRRAMKVPPLAQARARVEKLSDGRKASNEPIAAAPALTQTLFAATDWADVAFAKLKKFTPKNADDALQLQLACRDFCARFPDAYSYGDVRILAATHVARLQPGDQAKLDGWNAADGERDPKLSPEHRAVIAMRLTYNRARETARAGTIDYDDAVFDEVLAAARTHHATRIAHDSLITVALNVAPARAIAPLRELYPADTEVARAIQLLENIGQPCEIAFTALDGRAVNTRDYLGKVVLVDFWAKQLSFSTEILPKLDALVQRYGADNLVIVGVNNDDNRAAAEEIVEQYSLRWPIHHDGKGWNNAIAERFQAKILPYYLLLDREGRLRFRGIQPNSPAALKHLETLLAEKKSAGLGKN